MSRCSCITRLAAVGLTLLLTYVFLLRLASEHQHQPLQIWHEPTTHRPLQIWHEPTAQLEPTTQQHEQTTALERTTRLEQSTTESAEHASNVLRHQCSQLQRQANLSDLKPDVQQVVRWVCRQLQGPERTPRPPPTDCNKTVSYVTFGRLGNFMNLYAILYSFSRIYGVDSYIQDEMMEKLTRYFPGLSLPGTSQLPVNVTWQNITYQEAESHLKCQPGKVNVEPKYYLITVYPDRNGIDVFHPFYDELRDEFEFTERLRRQAQEFLRHARGLRANVTYIGVHVRRTDYDAYIRTKYHSQLPDGTYLSRALGYYRKRFPDALFIVCSDDLELASLQLQAHLHPDIVLAGNRDVEDPGRDMALLAACNHSVVTVGTFGFWGAYLAGGTVLVPEKQTHLVMGDRHTPLLEIQLAGADNWVTIR